jgi:hypothetical protein
MTPEQHYKLAQRGAISSMAQIKEYAQRILLASGINLKEVKIHKEGIAIQHFNKFVKKIYELGYEEFEARKMATEKMNEVDQKGEALSKFDRLAQDTMRRNLIRKGLSR